MHGRGRARPGRLDDLRRLRRRRRPRDAGDARRHRRHRRQRRLHDHRHRPRHATTSARSPQAGWIQTPTRPARRRGDRPGESATPSPDSRRGRHRQRLRQLPAGHQDRHEVRRPKRRRRRRDAGEPGLDGWTIYAYDDDGDGDLSAPSRRRPAATDDDRRRRRLHVSGLDPGSYIVCEVTDPAGWTQPFPTRRRRLRRRLASHRCPRATRSPLTSGQDRHRQRLRQLPAGDQDREEVRTT